MRVASTKRSAGQIGFANPGWWGIDVAVQTYKGSFWVKGRTDGSGEEKWLADVTPGVYNGSFTASLVSSVNNQTFAATQIQSVAQAGEW